VACLTLANCGTGDEGGDGKTGMAGSGPGGQLGAAGHGTGGTPSQTGGAGSGGSPSATGGSGGPGTGGASTGTGGSLGGAGGHNPGTGSGGTGPAGASGSAGRGGSAGGGVSTGGAAGAPFQPASHPKLPQVVTLGGPVLTAPKVLPIAYASDSGTTDIKAFLQEFSSSAAWTAETSEYGVGKMTVLPPVTVSGTAPSKISDSMLQQMIGTNTSGSKPWGTLDAKTIYLFVLPEGTNESDGSGSCCSEFDGYHSDAVVGSTVVPYAVACACPAFAGSQLTTLQGRTVAISHELVESATDPYPNRQPAYVQEDNDDIVWTLVTDGEVADMCEFNDDANIIPAGATYMIQRSWSNAAAARGDNPCVPSVTTTPYLNSFPMLSRISDDALQPGLATLGLNIPIGKKMTIPITLSSAAATSGTWTVKAYDYDQAVAGTTAGLALSLDKSTGRNGDTLQLTITPKVADPQIAGEAFLIISTYGKPGEPDYQTELTMGLVTN
jgi:hypothetical protein